MQKTLDRIKKAQSILLVTHKDPDGDAVGSMIACQEIIEICNPQAKVWTFLDENYRANLRYWVQTYCLQTKLTINPEEIDTVISLDCGDFSRIALPEGIENIDINIDHHFGEHFASHNLVNADRAAVGFILYDIVSFAKLPITPKMAVGIYLSIYTDTGRFSFANTDSLALYVAGKVAIVGGLTPHEFYSKLYETLEYDELVEFGKIVGNARKYFQGKVILAVIKQNSKIDNREVIDFIRRDRQAQLAVVLVDKGDYIKISFRSKGDLDVAKIANDFAGGGHKQAAAGKIFVNSLAQAEERLIKYLEQYL